MCNQILIPNPPANVGRCLEAHENSPGTPAALPAETLLRLREVLIFPSDLTPPPLSTAHKALMPHMPLDPDALLAGPDLVEKTTDNRLGNSHLQ